ncbi:MAG: ATP-binding protein, partial [Terricaulis sp.]
MQRLVSPILAERDQEMDALDRALEKSRRGQRRIVLVRGETGVGKSRLVFDFVTRAPGAVRVLIGSCLD